MRRPGTERSNPSSARAGTGSVSGYDGIRCYVDVTPELCDKFAGYEVLTDQAGAPYITEGMCSRVSCKVVDKLAVGNYIIYVGQVTEAEVLSDAEGLTLKSFIDRGKATPPQATVYREMVGNGFRCTVCGFVYQSETISPDYVCPICGAKAEKFVQQ